MVPGASRPDVRGNGRIVLLGSRGTYTPIVFNALKRDHPDLVTMLEGPVSRLGLAWRRIPKQGFFRVAGQVAFMAAVLPLLRRFGRRRIAEIVASAGLDETPISGPTVDVDTFNSDAAREHLRRLDPAVVVVSGTRLLSKKTRRSISAPFINIHMGISPAFRGVHGAYWALTRRRPELAGTTIHYIDAGIDTGPVLKQGTFAVTERDSFATYPYLHLATGIPLLREAVREVLAGAPSIRRVDSDLPSTLYYQPTAWQYFRHRVFGGVR